jgi:hypothetical protein
MLSLLSPALGERPENAGSIRLRFVTLTITGVGSPAKDRVGEPHLDVELF